MFEKLNYNEYLKDNPFYKGLGIDLKKYGKIDKKLSKIFIQPLTRTIKYLFHLN